MATPRIRGVAMFMYGRRHSGALRRLVPPAIVFWVAVLVFKLPMQRVGSQMEVYVSGATKAVSKLARAVKRLLSFSESLPAHLGLPQSQPARRSALAAEITTLLQRAAERRR